jgi:hypothetical protein
MPSPLAADPTQVSPLAAQNGPAAPATQLAPQPAPAAPTYDMANYNAATQQMKLNPQEQALYQMHLQNLHGTGGVDNPDGSRSTLYQTTFELDGKNYVIPTVWGGRILPPDQALQMAKQYGIDKFPSYASDQEAEARYQQMHQFMEQDTAAYFKNRKQ